MKTLFLAVNTVCDLTCRNCFYTSGYERRTHKRITPDEINVFLGAILRHEFSTVILTGGDPLCSKYKNETYELIHALKSHGVRVIVNTSAVKLSEEDVAMIIELGVDRLDISVNSLEPAIHNYERGCFDETVWAIKKFLESGYPHISTTTVISEYSAPLAARTLEWLLGIGVESVYYQPLFLPYEKQEYEIIQKAMEECSKVAKRPYTEFYLAQCDAAYSGLPAIRGSSCQMGEKCFTCEADGKLLACFHRSDIVLGNLIEDSPSVISQNIKKWKALKTSGLKCFGKHCASLFDNTDSWKEMLENV